MTLLDLLAQVRSLESEDEELYFLLAVLPMDFQRLAFGAAYAAF